MVLSENLAQSIASADIISFDVFGTLLLRPFLRDPDLFLAIAIEACRSGETQALNGFEEKRIKAERDARHAAWEEERDDITFDEIYSRLNIVDPLKSLLFKLEIDMEIRVSRRNDKVVEIFEYAKTYNKPVILMSDMYLPEDTIIQMLGKSNIRGYQELFVSSTSLKSKYRGGLFSHVSDKMNCKPESILHIGDNPISDVKNATAAGFSTFFMEFPKPGKFWKALALTSPSDKENRALLFWSSVVSGLGNLYEKNVPQTLVGFWQCVGYMVFGPRAFQDKQTTSLFTQDIITFLEGRVGIGLFRDRRIDHAEIERLIAIGAGEFRIDLADAFVGFAMPDVGVFLAEYDHWLRSSGPAAIFSEVVA